MHQEGIYDIYIEDKNHKKVPPESLPLHHLSIPSSSLRERTKINYLQYIILTEFIITDS